MQEYLLRTIFCVMSVATPTMMWGAEDCAPMPYEPIMSEMMGDEVSRFDVSVRGAAVQVHAVNCQGQILKIYDLVGKLKCEVHIDSNDKTVRVNLGKGVYLINVGGATRRIAVAG